MRTAIRLLVSDIDGTLLRHDQTLSDANRDAIYALQADGVAVTLISARPPCGMLALAGTLRLAGPLSAFNGGTLFDPDGTIRFAHRLDASDAAVMLRLIRLSGATAWVFTDGAWFVTDLDSPHLPRERRVSGLDPAIRTDFSAFEGHIDKIVAVSDDTALLTRVQAEGMAAIGARATLSRSNPHYLDVTHRLANKGDGLAALAQANGVDPSEVAALGDMNNDLPMFARAGLSVAMGQAPADVRTAADATAATSEQDGVADAITRFVRPAIAPIRKATT